MNQENIGKFIVELRKEKKLTQEQLAENLGVNNRSVSRWENGTCMPDYALLPLLAQEFGISVAELVEGKRTEANSYFLKETAYMNNYRILMEVNCKVALEENSITKEEKQKIIESLLDGIACKD